LDSKRLQEQVKQTASGWEPVLRLAYDEIIAVDPLMNLLTRLQKECPLTNLEIHSEILGGCADALMSERADIVLGITDPLPNLAKFHFELIGSVKFVFAVAPHHPLARSRLPITTEQIQQNYVIAARDSSLHSSVRSSMLLPEQQRITFSTMQLKKQAQMQGLGVGFFPYHLIKQDIQARRLIVKEVERTQPACQVYIGWNKIKMGNAHQWFIKQMSVKSFLKKLFT
jgi:DNA-binding transcriptional LysR family regulator